MADKSKVNRCVNIDWLEVYCLESEPRPAAFFLEDGWAVRVRDYGTRIYREMFTLLENNTGEPLIEVRRAPALSSKTQVLDPRACHIRLCNRTCYFDNAAKLLADFINKYGFVFQRISRIDLCMDFERFDSGDDPQKFLVRYLKKKYRKINQGNIRLVGEDLWDGQLWNSVSWGSKQSMISTKLYNKTLELQQVKDKPYIRVAWTIAGLVDDFITLKKTKVVKDKDTGESKTVQYNPTIWRLEFSISSSVKRWFVIEDVRGEKKKLRSIHHTLDCYFTKQQIFDVFASLADHYFHFKTDVRDSHGNFMRKDRCPDKELFRFQEQAQFFKIDITAASEPKQVQVLESLRLKLEQYKLAHIEKAVQEACDVLIDDILKEQIRNTASQPWNMSELTLLRQLVAYRIKKPAVSVDDAKATLMALMNVESDIFGEK